MTDKFKGWYPDYIENEKEREPILKLAKMMTGRAKKKLGLEKMTKYDPEYWGLALLCTDEQAEIALKMGVRQPKTLDQMVKVTGKDRGYLEKQLLFKVQRGYNFFLLQTRIQRSLVHASCIMLKAN